MPAVSVAQQHLMQAAEHGAKFPMAKKLRKSMSKGKLHEFAVGSEKGKPQHVLKGDAPDVAHENAKTMQNAGHSEYDSVRAAIGMSKKHPNRHKNLGNFLHKKKS